MLNIFEISLLIKQIIFQYYMVQIVLMVWIVRVMSYLKNTYVFIHVLLLNYRVEKLGVPLCVCLYHNRMDKILFFFVKSLRLR